MDINLIEQAFEKIIFELKRKGIKEIRTDIDYFWNIDMSDAIKFSEVNPKICVESLSDDYENIKDLCNHERMTNVLDLERIANIIRVMAYEIENSDI